jgi:hypothetical protein
VENVRNSPAENEQKAMRLILREHMINLVEVVTEKAISESLQRMGLEQKAVILMLRKHLINLAEDVKEKGSLRIGINSLVMAWHECGQSAKNECL